MKLKFNGKKYRSAHDEGMLENGGVAPRIPKLLSRCGRGTSVIFLPVYPAV